jgi:hypothetical protein
MIACGSQTDEPPATVDTETQPLSQPVSPGNGMVAGIPQSGGGLLFYCKDALLAGFDFFEKLNGWFPSVLHSSASLSPTHQVVDMAYAVNGTMTFKNVVMPTAGTRTITFRYAYASGLFPGITDRPEGIRVNGVNVANNMHFPITGGFSTYKTSSITANLKAGVNEITMFNVNDHGVGRVDTMTVK